MAIAFSFPSLLEESSSSSQLSSALGGVDLFHSQRFIVITLIYVFVCACA